MKNLSAFLICAGLTILLPVHAAAANVKVIANPNVKANSISAVELKSVYLGEKSSLDGMHVEPVLERSGPAHEVFVREYLGQSEDELQRYYRTLVFTGRGSMPKAVGSDAEVVAYVARTKGAIGYVSADANAEGVRTLEVSDLAASGPERKLISRIEPVYPEDLQKRLIGGIVRVKVVVAANGSVEKAELIGGNPILGDSAVAAVLKWKYAAAGSKSTLEISVPFEPRR